MAGELQLRAADLARYRIVYFATHGLLPGELRCQMEPALILSPPAGTARARDGDGLLEASEIAGLDPDADLVVLSACNTGGGGSGGGAALSGLAQSFFQAGARALVVSHWPVDSQATRTLMTALFERLAGAPSALHTAEALRQAQLTVLSNPRTVHPFFWAAFTLVGTGAAAP